MRWVLRLVSAGILFLLIVAACASDEAAPNPADVFDAAAAAIRADPPTSDLLQLRLNEPCVLVHRFKVGGEPLELVGSATALFGEVGDRYQCAWSGDAAGAANVRLEVVFIDTEAHFDDYIELVASRAGNIVVSTVVGDVSVASFTPDAGGLPVTTSILTEADRRAGVQFVVELVDPELRDSWSPENHAQLLASFGQ